MIRKITMSLMLTAFVGTVIGCGGALSEDELKAWADESGAFAKDYAEASQMLGELAGMSSTMAVTDMDDAAKAKYEEGAAKIADYQSQLQAIGEEWAKTTTAIGDGTDVAAWKSGVEAARKFITDNKAKLEEVKKGIADMKNMASEMAAAPATGDDAAAAPAENADATPAAEGENADAAKKEEGEKKEGM
ncbi:MAG: hypothetical protein KDD67_02960 [Ignavibacteriae bacterium]|nr:hypothetical protein [Ignavibacteriota bacterium]MCB9217001.1 hypothetical protein [Ignavibacteria bacterium]